MFKITVYFLNKKGRVKKSKNVKYHDFDSFIEDIIYYNSDKNFRIEPYINYYTITFDQLSEIITVLFQEPFTNPDNCKDVNELCKWLDSIKKINAIEEKFKI